MQKVWDNFEKYNTLTDSDLLIYWYNNSNYCSYGYFHELYMQCIFKQQLCDFGKSLVKKWQEQSKDEEQMWIKLEDDIREEINKENDKPYFVQNNEEFVSEINDKETKIMELLKEIESLKLEEDQYFYQQQQYSQQQQQQSSQEIILNNEQSDNKQNAVAQINKKTDEQSVIQLKREKFRCEQRKQMQESLFNLKRQISFTEYELPHNNNQSK